MTSDSDLLRRYAEAGSEDAFAELVRRHLDLVYSAALRQVNGDAHLAQDVAQTVFRDLARKAASLSTHQTLTGWLYTSSHFAANKAVRTEQRRHTHEQEAHSMRELLLDSGPELDWTTLRHALDAVMHELNDADREAILLRYFEHRQLAEIGERLGLSEDAARKRVDRALEKLREHFAKKGITTTAAALSVVIAANAVQSAPVGLATAITAAAVISGTAVATSTAITATKIIAMTTLQKAVVTLTVAVLAGAGIYEAHQALQLREQNQALQQQQAPLTDQLQQLRRERDDATNRLSALTDELARVKKNPSELLKLRSQVGTLRQEKAAADSQSAVSKALANPETRKSIREHNKMVSSGIYSDLAKRLQLTPEQTGQLNDLMADHVMDSLDLITQALRDHKSQAEVRQIFSASDTALQGKVQALLGDDALTQFQDYTKNISSTLFVNSFASSLTGDPAMVADKKSRLLQAMQDATQSALAAAGLPANYQTMVAANPGNFASEDEAAYNIQLKDNIFAQTAARASAFLSPDELNKFQEMRADAIKNTQNYVLMERKLLSPVSQ
ncbi:RNA polymerase sigma factor [Pedosphaera parvula]|uniref:RNA polymerase, sigma-24 subunit, ECF subfamily n=1 Tax=Pedosphaera parvula (strain Ellin514) TaxID=320771 RepID=B9XK77_PEDPL|nr:sigma-70 family RNA polymerase sigma factor [Pedosphaera parvula]EEF59715.1 RNA polymerase, sigma-24 subunit, ECF subfamily [Pedosphaera parvula Ellin514]